MYKYKIFGSTSREILEGSQKQTLGWLVSGRIKDTALVMSTFQTSVTVGLTWLHNYVNVYI